VAAAAEVAAGVAAAEVAAGAAASVVAAVAGLLAAVVAAADAAAAGAVASGSVPAWAAWAAWAARAARVAGVAPDPGERAACAKSHEKRRCDGRRITSGLPKQSDEFGVGRHFAKVHKSSFLTANTYRLRSITH
jgi:hypothetical protein